MSPSYSTKLYMKQQVSALLAPHLYSLLAEKQGFQTMGDQLINNKKRGTETKQPEEDKKTAKECRHYDLR